MSVYRDILIRVKTLVQAALPGVGVAIRKRLQWSADAGDQLPFACIAPVKRRKADRQTATAAMPGGGVWWDYPVLVALYDARGGAIESEDEILATLDRIETVTRALDKSRLEGVPRVFDCVGVEQLDAAFAAAGLDAASVDTVVLQFTWRTSEARGS